MKKILIITLSLLMLLAFVSCEKDKTPEITSTFEEFLRNYSIGMAVRAEVVNSVSKDTPESKAKDYIKDSVPEILRYLGNEYASSETTDATGTIKGEYTAEGKTILTFDDITASYKYKEKGGTEEKTGEMKFGGTISEVETDDGWTVVSTLSVNGTEYGFSFTDKDGKFTAASVNGKDVNLRLLNAGSGF